MKRIPLFRPGRHTDSHGTSVKFTEDALRAAVDGYDPAIHEAPLVVGHPRDNLPAFGWVGAMDFRDGTVGAVPRQVNADFAQMVKDGAFKKISASWYPPESPSNPKPGIWYLRHVGFLGAAAPAIKGLPPLEFADDDADAVTITEPVDFAALETWDAMNLAGLFRRLREFLIDRFDRDTADGVVPAYAVEDLEAASRRPEPPPESKLAAQPEPAPMFSEPNTGGPTVADKTPAPGATQNPPAAAAPESTQPDRTAEFAEMDRKLREREARILAKEQEIAQKEVASFVDGLVTAGKVLPKDRDGLASFIARIGGDQVVEFSEGERQVRSPAAEWFRGFLQNGPVAVDYGERSGGDDGAIGNVIDFDEATQDIGRRAADYQEAEAKAGREITIAQAVQYVTRQKAAS